MGHSEDTVAELGAARRGIVLTHLAGAAGVPEHALKQLRLRGLLVPVGRGIDRLRDHPFAFASRCQAAVDLAGPGAVLGLRTAARLHEFYVYRYASEIEVVVRRGRDHRTSIGRLVQTGWLPDGHVAWIDGLPVTSAARTFFDLCGHPEGHLPLRHPAHERKMLRVYNDALAHRGLTFSQEAAVLLVLARRGRAGTRLVRRILTSLGPTYQPTASDTEELFLEVVHAFGLPEPEKQVAISDEQGWIGTVDFLWRRPRHIVEVDSTWHDGPLDSEADKERDRRYVAAGYTVARYRYGRLVGDPSGVARELGAATSE